MYGKLGGVAGSTLLMNRSYLEVMKANMMHLSPPNMFIVSRLLPWALSCSKTLFPYIASDVRKARMRCMMDIADGQELPGGDASHNDKYFISQDVLCVQIIALGTLLK